MSAKGGRVLAAGRAGLTQEAETEGHAEREEDRIWARSKAGRGGPRTCLRCAITHCRGESTEGLGGRGQEHVQLDALKGLKQGLA